MKEIKIYSTTYCPYCQRAKMLLDAEGLSYTEINVEEDAEKRAELAEKYNWQTVPMITIGDEFIGGFDDLAKLQASEELVNKVNS
ncbi:glutathione S-transferase N-terminal domain-containing protein [Patescibacteria group bacterium]|nr:glutathione S-transferase N-terminal domain-containing protein [Patescibacteria group bacterium]MBU1721191.1 glutathione S-transferase N-terminal domain-containing protein [Patescibacteria group bacterium]MBU1901101.1 glutathione S-transferase N-terminal domain-containing protein [Patescibacteria group bacterium]